MKKQKEKDEECPGERTFINRGNNNKRYRKNVRAHIHISQDMQHIYDWTDADVVEAFSLLNKTHNPCE